MSFSCTEDAGDAEGGTGGGEEFKAVFREKSPTEKQLQERKQEKVLKKDSKTLVRNLQRREAYKDSRAVKSVDRYNPYSSASRKLIQTNPNSIKPNSNPSARCRSLSSDDASSPTSSLQSFDEVAVEWTRVPFLGTSFPAMQATEFHELIVTSADRKSLARDEILFIQAEIATAEIAILESSGSNPHDIMQTKCDTFNRSYILTCNSHEALSFYKQALESCDSLPKDHAGFKCYYKPIERQPGQ